MLARGRRWRSSRTAPRGQKTAARAGEGEVHAQHDGLRAQKRPLPGKRPGLPPEPEPQGAAATVGYVAAGAPLLAVSSLRGAEGVDDTAVQFLLRAELKKKKEEDEERQQELADEALDDMLEAELDALLAIDPERLTSRQDARLSAVLRERAELVERRKRRRTTRKMKKRKKKKLPRSGLTRRRRRQWRGRYAGHDVPHHGWYGPEGLFRGSDVAVLHQGHQHLCRGAEAHSHGLAAQQIMVIPQCLFDKVVDVLVVQIVQFHRCRFKLCRRLEISQVLFLDKLVVLPVAVQDRRSGPDRTEICGVSAVAVLGQGCGLACCGAGPVFWFRQYRNPWRFRRCSSWTRLWTCPLVCMSVQTVQNTVDFPQVHVLDRLWTCPFVYMSVQTVQDVVDISLVAQRQFIMVLSVVLVLMRIRLMSKDCACLSVVLVLMRIRLMGKDCPCLSVVLVLMRIRLMGKDCACLCVVLVLMRIRLMGKDCACLSVVLVLVCSVLDMLYGYGDVGKVCAFVLRGQGVDMPVVVLDRCPISTCRKLWSSAVAVRRSGRVVSV